jgi:hypothetical protein
MKTAAKILMACLASLATFAPVGARAQDPYANTIPSNSDRLRGDADDARQRESDLTNQVAAQERANAALREQMRKADADPAGLQKDLVDASAEASAARKKVSEQRLRRDVAQDKLSAARAAALAQHENAPGMHAARRAVEDAAAELERLSGPILERLEQNPEYQEAQALVDAAAQTGEALQSFDAVDPKAQAEADLAFEQAMAAARGIEDAAIDADPQAREARKAVAVAQDTLQGLRAENEKRLGGDKTVDAAKFALDLEQRLLDDATAGLAGAEKRLSALRQTVEPQGGQAGGGTELARQLKEGEERLRDLNDALDQARIARQDSEERLRYAQGGTLDGVPLPADGGGYAPPAYEPAPIYEPAPTYVYRDYSYGDYYGYPYSTHGGYSYYPTYRHYDPYCPPYWRSGLFVGIGFSSYYHRPWYRHHHHHHHHDYGRSVYSFRRGDDRYYTTSSYRYRGRDESWRRQYDTIRSVGARDRVASSVGDRRYDYYRFNRDDVARDRSTRSNLDAARRATADAERDYRFRSDINRYDRQGGGASAATWRLRDQQSIGGVSRARDYEDQVRQRRAAADADAARQASDRTGDRGTRGGAVTRIDPAGERASDTSSRRARAEAETQRARGGSDDSRVIRIDERPGSNSARNASEGRARGESAAPEVARSARGAEDVRRTTRSADDGASARRSRAAEETSRARAAEAPPVRSSTPRASEAPRVSESPRSRSSEAPRVVEAPRVRGGDSSPSRGSGRVESAPPARSTPRGESFRSSPAPSSPPPSASRGGGSSRSEAPSAGSRGGGGGRSEAPSSSRGGGSSSSSRSGGGDSGGGRRR